MAITRAIPAGAGAALVFFSALAPWPAGPAAGADDSAPVVRGAAPALGAAPAGDVRRLLRGHSFTLIYEGDRLLEVNVLPDTGRPDTADGVPPTVAAEPAVVPATEPRPLILDHITGLELIRVLEEDEDEVARTRAVSALRKIEGPEAARALMDALGDEAPVVRVHAIHALGAVEGSATAIKQALAHDPDPHVRRAAAEVLEHVRGPGARQALEATAVSDPDRAVRREARQALARWDDPARRR